MFKILHALRQHIRNALAIKKATLRIEKYKLRGEGVLAKVFDRIKLGIKLYR
jgi:hypothetical protein